MHLRSLKRVRGEVSLYDPIGVDREGNEITLVNVPESPHKRTLRIMRRARCSAPLVGRCLQEGGDQVVQQFLPLARLCRR